LTETSPKNILLAMKIILVLLDGLGDRSYEILNHRTPLQAASTPNLDRLARLGSNGLFHASSPGQCLPSETAHYLLFGYDLKTFPGRGLLEAVGAGVEFEDRDVLAMAHLSGVSWENGVPILTHGRKEIQGDELGELFAALTPYESHGIRFRLRRTKQNDGVLILSGGASPYLSDSDPMVVGRAVGRILPLSENPEPQAAGRTARALNSYLEHCHRVLTDHEANRLRALRGLPPANFLATQRCGRRIVQEPFAERWGMSAMFIASGSVYAGFARELGFKHVPVKDGSDPGEDLRERLRIALEDGTHGFVHVHTKVPDEAAHEGDPRRKRDVITSLDRGMDELVEAVRRREDFVLAVTADHSTPSVSDLIHSGEPVPVMVVCPHVRRDPVSAFDEVSAAAGCLGLVRGQELMAILLSYADRSALLGHRLGPGERPYFPDNYEPFRMND